MNSRSRKLNILISQPGFQFADYDFVYLPYLYGILKSYCNRDTALKQNTHWLNPIYVLDEVQKYEDRITRQPIDVLGLSCYIWNWSFNVELARRVKELYPDCLVVAGGPHPDWNADDFFQQHPFIDLIVKRDGEEPFRRILTQRMQGELRPAEISGLVYQENGQKRDSGPAQMTTDFDYFPYHECAEEFRQIISKARRITAILETNRGCPYKCSFCDIGSKEFSKIRQVSLARVKAEIEWLSEQKISNVLCTDSNFGILERDLEITDFVVEKKRQNGFPQVWEYDSAKMHVEANHAIALKLWEAQLITKYKVPWQHLDQQVLQAIQRREPDAVKKAHYARKVQREGIRTRPELILGMPGDTPKKFRQSIFQIFEYGLSDALRINLMLLLPNAPANTPEYREKWKIKTVKKPVAPLHINYNKSYSEFSKSSRVEVVVATSTYNEDDWVEMMTDDSLLRVWHSVGNLVKFIAYYFRHRHNLRFEVFYDDLISNFANSPNYPYVCNLTEELRQLRYRYLNSDSIDYYDYRHMNIEFLLGGSEYFYSRTMEDPLCFYRELKQHLLSTYSDVSHAELEDLLQFQLNMLITEDYDYRLGKRFDCQYDWVEFFRRSFEEQTEERDNYHRLPQPGRIEVQAFDKASNYLKGWKYDWAEASDTEARKSAWIHLMTREWNHWSVEGTRVFQKLKTRSLER